MLTPMSATDEDFDTPILPGGAPSDYERYLNTEELLALQKGPEEWVHRDELLFQVVHQSGELWLKLATSDVEEAARQLRRPLRCLRYVTDQLDMLEELSPWEYQEIRKVLGHGSGFDSPGFKRTHEVSQRLAAAFHGWLTRRGLDLRRVYRESAAHEDVFQVAERLIDWDERLMLWRTTHLRLVERVIGGHVIGTQGTPVEVLGRRLEVRHFPDLWDIRNALTDEAHTSPSR
jgi:tryptophan 2,3-dioxygenase